MVVLWVSCLTQSFSQLYIWVHNKRGEGEIFHALSWKKKENPLIKQKNALILEESALFDVSLG